MHMEGTGDIELVVEGGQFKLCTVPHLDDKRGVYVVGVSHFGEEV